MPPLVLTQTGLSSGVGLTPGTGGPTILGAFGLDATSFTSSATGTQTSATPLAVGHVFLVTGTRAEALKQLRDAGVTPVATRELSLPEFVGALLLRLREQPTGAVSQYTLFALRDSPDVHFAAPVFAEATAAAEAAVQPRPVFTDRLPDLVRAAPDAKTRTAAPPLLRELSETITANLLRLAPIPRIAEQPEQPFHQKLVAAGVGTYGALLSRKPEEVNRAVGLETGKELSEILLEGESVTASAAKAVLVAVANVAKATGAASPRDLNNEEGVKQLAATISEALLKEKRLALPEPVVTAVVAAAVKDAGS